MKKNVVYLNRFNEVKPYKVELIYEIGEYAEVLDLEAIKMKTFKLFAKILEELLKKSLIFTLVLSEDPLLITKTS